MTEEQSPKTHALYAHARKRIPGGSQLLSKRPEMFAPEVWPAYFKEAHGCEVWDLDGNRYVDMSHNGVGACLLGYAHPQVVEAVQERISKGHCSTLNSPDEVELADELCRIHPWADQVRFARGGGEACAVAVRIARASTGRSMVAVCGYHGWEDWYLAANLSEGDALSGHLLDGLEPAGVPNELRGTVHTFPYENWERLDAIAESYGDQLAAIIMEPCRYRDPDPSFLTHVRDVAHRIGAVLIFDEITIGWRTCFGGTHLRLDVEPDMAVFAKALGNGHPMSAVIGRSSVMTGAENSFISSTTWTEAVGPVAALATLGVMQETEVWNHVKAMGLRVQSIWMNKALKYHLPIHEVEGHPCLAYFSFDHPESNELKTLFTQLMLSEGYLASTALYPTLAHNESIVDDYGEAVDQVFQKLSAALDDGTVAEQLKGAPAQQGFQRLL